jgi:hypothetical protein
MKTTQKIDKKLVRRFFEKIELTPTCWNWGAYCSTEGYGMFFLKPKSRLAHRVSYWIFRGKIELDIADDDETIVIDHLCNNKRCVNPAHLEVVTQSVNTLRGIEYHAARRASE